MTLCELLGYNVVTVSVVNTQTKGKTDERRHTTSSQAYNNQYTDSCTFDVPNHYSTNQDDLVYSLSWLTLASLGAYTSHTTNAVS